MSLTDKEIDEIWNSLFDAVEETEEIVLKLIPMCECFWCQNPVDENNNQ